MAIALSFALLSALPASGKSVTGKKTSAKKSGSHKITNTKGLKEKPVSKRSISKRSGKPHQTSSNAPARYRQSEPTAERYITIQQALAEKGYYTGPLDGKWNPSCVDALKKFQQDQNLGPDGKLGALSLIALGLGPKREPMQQMFSKPEPAQ